MARIGFGGGCHWCTEAVFQSLKGVGAVEQGFICSDPPDDSFSEAVILTYEPDEVSIRDLVLAHVLTHASTAAHKMRGKYRSAIYGFGAAQVADAQIAIDDIAQQSENEFVTRVLPYRGFKPSDQRFHDYYANNPERPFCQTYIDPKLTKLRQELPRLMKETVAT